LEHFLNVTGYRKGPPVQYLPRGGLFGFLSRALVEIGVFLFIKMLFFDGLTTISASFDKAQSGDGVLLYYLEKFGHGSSSKRAAKCAIGIRYRPHRWTAICNSACTRPRKCILSYSLVGGQKTDGCIPQRGNQFSSILPTGVSGWTEIRAKIA
jgi:hypothetical protein